MLLKPLLPVFTLMLLFTQCFSETDSSQIEFRKPRQWALSAEVGLNSLSSLVGPVFSYYVRPQVALDLGVGLSSTGTRPGLRARYLFSKEKTSFFGGAGFKYGLGTDGEKVDFKDTETKVDLKMTLGKSAFMDLMLGVDFLANNGFLVLAEIGWSQLITKMPYTIVDGTPSQKTIKALDFTLGSGLMLSASLGKAF
jgi:hypothetical protein